jgi:16S rRNA (cytidine1402-2'-O)-methyltransferase
MLYLLPNLLADVENHVGQLPASVDTAVATLTGFLRRFAFPPPKTFRDIPIRLLNEHSKESDKKELLKLIKEGGIWGLVSDCGMPCLADPGADLVLMAREAGIPIETFAGPSSVVLALVLSGLGGQHFTFHGYLPKEESPLIQELKRIEKRSLQEGSTHLFIETPYRNVRMFEKIIQALDDSAWLCVACDLCAQAQWVQTRRIKDWKKCPLPEIDKRPAVFIIRR